ncbi:MAG: hypothetical protein HYT83_00420 [Candidatus Levybacteria bacterium]|nr:hypothetical protein [Candidatus Levybacteria bacterium]
MDNTTTIVSEPKPWSFSKKLVWLMIAAILGAFIAKIWNYEVTDPLALQFQKLVVGTVAVLNSTLAVILAFVSGMSMIITACGWPMILNLTAMAQESRSRRTWLISVGLYTLGLMIVMAIVGAIVGFLGGYFIHALEKTSTKLIVTVSVYTLVGLYALLGALQEFGFINVPTLFPWLKQPRFVSGLKGYKQSFVLGAVIGGGFGVGCPFPTYHAVLAFIAAIGSPIVGATALAANAVGRVIPIFIVGSLILGGFGTPKVFTWIQKRSETIHMINGIALAVLGVFMIVYWTILVGTKVFLK